MVIETEGKPNEPQAREATNILLQGAKLLKKPDRKLQDFFKACKTFAILLIVGLVLNILLFVLGDVDLDMIMCAAVWVCAAICMILFRGSVYRIYRDLLKREGKVVITFDPEKIDYDAGDQRYTIFWNKISFFREFQEEVAILPTEMTGVLILINMEYKDQIKAFLKENNLNIKYIERK